MITNPDRSATELLSIRWASQRALAGLSRFASDSPATDDGKQLAKFADLLDQLQTRLSSIDTGDLDLEVDERIDALAEALVKTTPRVLTAADLIDVADVLRSVSASGITPKRLSATGYAAISAERFAKTQSVLHDLMRISVVAA